MSGGPKKADGFKVPAVPKRVGAQIDKGFPALEYKEPPTAGVPQYEYSLEVVKDGSVAEEHIVARDKTFQTFGRLPVCDYPMDHASVSRYHVVLQFYENGTMAIIDLGSSHGTLVNKKPVAARTPLRVDVGDQIVFGMSSRIWIIGSSDPAYLERCEGEQQQQTHDTAASGHAQGRARSGRGGSPQLGDDVVPKRAVEATYQSNPVKYLRRFLDKCEHTYQPEAIGDGDNSDNVLGGAPGWSEERKQHSGGREAAGIRIELPFADGEGRTMYGTAFGVDRAEAERLACLDALHQLDKHGYLHIHQRRRAAPDMAGIDSDDNSDDHYYDNTKKSADEQCQLDPGNVETYESLSHKLTLADDRISGAEQELAQVDSAARDGQSSANGDEDELDTYMSVLARGDQLQRRNQLVDQLARLRNQKSRLESLLGFIAPNHRGSPTREEPEVQPTEPEVQPTDPEEQPKEQVKKLKEPVEQPKEPVEKPKESVEQPKEKRQRVQGPMREEMAQHVSASTPAQAHDGIAADSDSSWQPPTNQTGDGRTSLNDKYGY